MIELAAQAGKWVECEGTYYYMGNQGGNSSALLLDNVTLNHTIRCN